MWGLKTLSDISLTLAGLTQKHIYPPPTLSVTAKLPLYQPNIQDRGVYSLGRKLFFLILKVIWARLGRSLACEKLSFSISYSATERK